MLVEQVKEGSRVMDSEGDNVGEWGAMEWRSERVSV